MTEKITGIPGNPAEGVPASAGVMQGPLYAKAVFRNHGFFAGRWPIQELGLTTMDYTKPSSRGERP